MTEKQLKAFAINTERNSFKIFENNKLCSTDRTNKKSDSIIDWLISAKIKVTCIPINMRKFAAYAATLKQKIQYIPLVLRKRFMLQRIMNG